MKDILEKLSPYNIFNHLLPGVVFVAVAEVFLRRSFTQKDLLVGLFLYYFIGMVISRLGSLVIEPVLKKVYFIRFADYRDFISAAQKDPKIEVLSEVNNTYRTLCALFALLGLLRLYEEIENLVPAIRSWAPLVAVAFLFILFLISYKKQTSYIRKRIEGSG